MSKTKPLLVAVCMPLMATYSDHCFGSSQYIGKATPKTRKGIRDDLTNAPTNIRLDDIMLNDVMLFIYIMKMILTGQKHSQDI